MSIYRSDAGRVLIRDWCLDQLDRWPVAHERIIVTAHCAATHLAVAGTGESTVLFVPGTNFNAAVSSPLASALVAAGDKVFLADVPGQPGLSAGERVAAADRLPWYGAWLDDLIDQIRLEKVAVIGHSLGAAIAMSATSPHIDRRLLVSPGGLTRARLTRGVVAASTMWLLRPTPARSARLLRTMLAPGHQPRAELIEWMTLVAQHTRSSRDPGRTHPKVALSNSAVVSAEHDVFFPPHRLDSAVRAVLGVDLHVVPDAGHLVVEEHPATIASLARG
jgi:pimeloyl-ACP methyl ester carboxylesterase